MNIVVADTVGTGEQVGTFADIYLSKVQPVTLVMPIGPVLKLIVPAIIAIQVIVE